MSVGERSAGGGGSPDVEPSRGLGGRGGGTTSPTSEAPVEDDNVRGTW